MRTPITDAEETAYDNGFVQGAFVDADFARRLELDRAALMEACDQWISERDNPSPCWVMKQQAEKKMRAALSTARANFPEQSDTEPQ